MAQLIARMLSRAIVFMLPALIEVALQILRDRKYQEQRKRWMGQGSFGPHRHVREDELR